MASASQSHVPAGRGDRQNALMPSDTRRPGRTVGGARPRQGPEAGGCAHASTDRGEEPALPGHGGRVLLPESTRRESGGWRGRGPSPAGPRVTQEGCWRGWPEGAVRCLAEGPAGSGPPRGSRIPVQAPWDTHKHTSPVLAICKQDAEKETASPTAVPPVPRGAGAGCCARPPRGLTHASPVSGAAAGSEPPAPARERGAVTGFTFEPESRGGWQGEAPATVPDVAAPSSSLRASLGTREGLGQAGQEAEEGLPGGPCWREQTALGQGHQAPRPQGGG